MARRNVSLQDKYEAVDDRVFIGGVQALVRLPLDQARSDRHHGLNTGGFISGYRGSPLGGYDQQLMRIEKLLDRYHIQFQPGVNEDLAATAVWGSQQVNLHPGATVDGVFGIWYGKAPGVDRSGDVFKHANMTGTWRHGGVLAVAGDDPLAKSSTLPCQSEFAFIDAEIPVLAPADVQDVLDLGLHGIALSRFSGLWAGMVAASDVMDASATINVDPARLRCLMPEDDGAERHMTLSGLKLPSRHAAEMRLRHLKLPAAKLYARINRLNATIWDSRDATLGIMASGKSWQALTTALDLLGIDRRLAGDLGLRLMKVSMPWPLEPESAQDFCRGLRTVLVVEAKRPLIETQLKDQLYHLDAARRPDVLGKQDLFGTPLLSDVGDLDPVDIAAALLGLLPQSEALSPMRDTLARLQRNLDIARAIKAPHMRAPHFCSGCPHNSSTKVPQGSRAMAGIGCHIMAQWMPERAEDSFSQMGGEGVPWLGQSAFTGTAHVFANLGDGTYHHSGSLAIRAAIGAKVNVTYKILYNDAVAMTGGQSVDGPQSVAKITHQMAAEGVRRIVVVAEEPMRHRAKDLAPGTSVLERGELDRIQKELRQAKGVSVLIFDQTCAAEKRRRRKRGQMAEPNKRLFINDRVCEGCGDCSVQSNCLSIEPLPTSFGTKRQINQASCNKDYSCAKGFCPSFVVVEGASLKGPSIAPERLIEAASDIDVPGARADRSANILLTGIGGMGVTTVSAILAMAAHIDRKEVATLDVTGLAQKGGAVVSHLRLGAKGVPPSGSRIAPGEADCLIAGDLVVSAGEECLSFLDAKRSVAVVDADISPTAAFTLHQSKAYGTDRQAERLEGVVGSMTKRDVSQAARYLLGDQIYANMMLAGMAFQRGWLPISLKAIEQAITLNGVAKTENLAAFHAGRLMVAAPERLELGKTDDQDPADESLDLLIERLKIELVAYQNEGYAARFLQRVASVRLAETALCKSPDLPLTRAVAETLFKLMAYKDEYEVARLYGDPAFKAKLDATFEGKPKLSLLLAPPLLSRLDPATGRPRKLSFGPWIFTAFRLMARLKGLRGRAIDPFGWTEERRMERRLIDDFERMVDRILPLLSPEKLPSAIALAKLPAGIRGYGPIKLAKAKAVEAECARQLALFERLSTDTPVDHGSLLIAAE